MLFTKIRISELSVDFQVPKTSFGCNLKIHHWLVDEWMDSSIKSFSQTLGLKVSRPTQNPPEICTKLLCLQNTFEKADELLKFDKWAEWNKPDWLTWTMKYWLVYRDPYIGLWNNPHIIG